MIDYTQILAKNFGAKLYFKELNKITGGVHCSIFLAQLTYWAFKSDYKPFYKFRQPCEHELYKEGDSWVEELGFDIRTIDKCIKTLKELEILETKITIERVTFYYLNATKLNEIIEKSDIYINSNNAIYENSINAIYENSNNAIYENSINAILLHNTKNTSKTTSKNTTKKPDGDLFCENLKPKNSKRFLCEVDKPACISSEVWADWIQHKKDLKDSFTEIGIKSLKTRYENLSKKGHNINELMIEAISRGWHDIVVRDLPQQNSFKKRETTMDELEARNKQHIAEINEKMEKAAAEYGIDPDLLKNYDPALERSDDF